MLNNSILPLYTRNNFICKRQWLVYSKWSNTYFWCKN